MNTSSELLDHVRCVIKLFESSLDETCTAYGLSHLEADILAFLKNNPNWDTARDISEYRMIQRRTFLSELIPYLERICLCGSRIPKTVA